MRYILNKSLFAISAVTLLMMVGLLFFQVVSRELAFDVDWTEEMSRFSFISMVFFAAAYNTLGKGHLRVRVFSDFIATYIGEKPLELLRTLLLIGFSATITYYAYSNLMDGIVYPNISAALGFNQNLLFIAMCSGFVLILINHILDLFEILCINKK